MTTLWAETWTGSNGSSWPGRWSHTGPSPNTPDIQSNAGRQRTGTTAFTTSICSRANGETAVADMEVLVKCSFDNPKKTEYTLVAVRMDTWSPSYPSSGYFVELEVNSNQFTLRKGVSASYTTLSTTAKTFTAGTAVWIRLRAFGTAIKAKIWDDGSSEPGSWDTEVTDSSVTAAGYAGLSMQSGVGSVCTATWDDLTVTDPNASVSPAAIAASVSVPTTAVGAGAGASPAAVAASVSVPAVTVQVTADASVSVGAVAAPAGIPAVTAGGGASASPATIPAPATMPPAGVRSGNAGKFHRLVDDFSAPGINLGTWATSGAGVAWVSDGGSAGHVELDEATSANELYTVDTHDLVNSHVSADIVFPVTPNAPIHIMQLAPVQANTGTDHVSWIRVNTSDLIAVMKSGGVTIAQAALTYNATNHRYLRISEHDGTVTWWTSPDGQAWASALTADTATWGTGMTALHLNFFSITFGSDIGQVLRVDAVNGNGNSAVEPTAVAAPVAVPSTTVHAGAGMSLAAIAAPVRIPTMAVHAGPTSRDRITDPFDGANGAVTTYGRTAASWDAVTGAGSITSNMVTGSTAFDLDLFRSVDYFPIDDMSVSVAVDTLSSADDRSASVLLRMHETAATYYQVEVNEQNDRYIVQRVIDGDSTNISGGFVGLAEPLVLPTTLRATIQGNRIRVYIGGQEIGDYYDDAIVSGKHCGFGFYNSGGVSRLNNFDAYHLGSAQIPLTAIALAAVVPTPAVSAGGLSGIPGLIARYTAEGLTGFVANGNPVSSWTSWAGSEYPNALTSSGTAQPTMATNQQNGLPAVRFTRASAQHMDSGAWSHTYPVPLTIFAVFKFATLPAWMDLWSGRSLVYTHASANPTRLVAGAGSVATMTEPTPLDTSAYHAVGIVYDGTGSKIFYDSLTPTFTGATDTNAQAAMPGIRIGTTSEASGAFLDGWVAEVIAVGRAVGDAEMAGIMGQLAARYGLSWAPIDPGPPAPPVEGDPGPPAALPEPPTSDSVPTPHYGIVFDSGPASTITLPLKDQGGYVDFEVSSISALPNLIAQANTTLAVSATLPLAGTNSLTMTRNAGSGTGDMGWTMGAYLGFNPDGRNYVLWFPVRPGAGASNRTVQVDVEWLDAALATLGSTTFSQAEGTGYVSVEGYTWVGLRSTAPTGSKAIRWYVTVKNVPAGETHHLDSWTMRYFGVNVGSRLKARKEARGRADDLATFEAGNGEITLNNDDGLFTPGGTGYPVDLRQQVTLVWEWQGRLYPGFVGYTEDWENIPLGDGVADVVCTFNDYFEVFTGQTLYPAYQSVTLNPRMAALLTPHAISNPPRAYFPLGESSGSTVAGSLAGRGGSAKLATASAGTGGTAFGAQSFQDVHASGHSSDGDISCVQFNTDISAGKGAALDVSAVPGVFPLPGKSWTVVLQVTIPDTAQSQIFYRSAVSGATDLLSGLQIEAFSDGTLRVVTFSDTPLSTTLTYDTGGRYIVTVSYDHTVGPYGKIRLRAFGSDVSKTLAGNPFANGLPTLAYLGGAFFPINSTITYPFQGKMAHVSFWDQVVPDQLVDVLELIEVVGIRVDDRLAIHTACAFVGYPTEYAKLDAGLTNLLPLHWASGSKPLELLREFASYSGASVLMGPDGRLAMHNRLRRANPTPRYTFSGTATGARSVGLSSKLDRARLANSVDVSRVSGGSYRFTDEVSVAKYGEVTAGSFEFPITSEDEVVSYGKAVVSTRSVPKPETRTVEFSVAGKPTLIDALLKLEIGDFIEIGDLPDTSVSSTVSGFIEKIEGFSDSPLLNFKYRLALSPPGTQLVYGEIPDVTPPPPPVVVPPTPPPPTPPPAPSGFWASGGSAHTGVQAESDRWGTWRGRACTLCLCYNTRNGGWGSFMPNTGQPSVYTKNSYRLVLQTSPFPEGMGANYAALISGAYDSQWTQFGTILKAQDEAVGRLPTIVSVAWEMNGTYFPWGYNSGRPEQYTSTGQYRAGFQRVSNVLRAAYSNVKIAWVTNGHTNPVPASDLYPGDAYVDFLGTDYYDHYPSAPNAASFDSEGHKADAGIWWYLQMARDHGKALIVPEWGIAPGSTGGNTTGDNPIFITKMFEVFQNAHSTGHMAGECYFNDDMGGGNVDSDLINGGNPRSAAEYVRLY